MTEPAIPDGTGPEAPDGWDVFISYAREDYEHASRIIDSLQACITSRGVPPRIFHDADPRDGVPVGMDWHRYLEEALRRSRYIVPLYSMQYFSKDVCRWELQRAVDLHEAGNSQLRPVLMENTAKDKVPFTAIKYQWLHVARPNWIEELREALDLRFAENRRRLQFLTAVPDAVVNHTLPKILVAVTGPNGTPVLESGEAVTLATLPPDPGLNGTLVTTTVRGEATFADLAFRKPAESVRLVAQAPGCEHAETSPIHVSPPAPQPADQDQGHPTVPASGRPVFFPDSRSLAVLDGHRLTVHTLECSSPTGSAQLAFRPRLWACGSRRLAVADWTGRVVVAAPDGETCTADLASTKTG